MEKKLLNNYVSLNTNNNIWEHFYTVAPLIVVGSKEGSNYNLAPKHMATPIGFSNYFGFVCTPKHQTYHNIKKEKKFTISFVKPNQILITSLAASCRDDTCECPKEIIKSLPTIQLSDASNLFVEDSYLLFNCSLFKIIDGFDNYSIITGKIKEAFIHKNYKVYSDIDKQLHVHNNPVPVYIAQGRFANIKESFNFPFPKDFKK